MRLPVTSARAAEILQADAADVVVRINEFTSQTFKTRGGRLGSGMGSLLEALWVYHMNTKLQNEGGEARACELGWLQDHEPADFACLYRGADWDPATRHGELLRIEAKSMNIGVDEAKGHFTNLASESQEFDQLLVLVWRWTPLAGGYVWPKIHDHFLGPALPVIRLRDELHVARGGSFVAAGDCPDGCEADACSHVNEPLNAAGKRERKSGPSSRKPANVDYAANFGGLIRMLKTDNDAARQIFRRLRREDEVAHQYISFIHKHYSSEEVNQYRKAEWQAALQSMGLVAGGQSASEANLMLRESIPDYQNRLKDLF